MRLTALFFVATLPLLASTSVLSSAPFASPQALRATVVDTDHIDLNWKVPGNEPGGCFIEFRLNDEKDFSLLAIAWRDITSFRHPDVARDTRFGYRLSPFFGAPSDLAEITTGAEPTAGTFSREVDGPLPALASEAAPPRVNSLRIAATFLAARPLRLMATRPSATTVDLRWADCASDEDGYLVEISSADAPGWQVCALLPADSRSFRKTRLPPNTTCRFRVRAYFHGAPSEAVSVLTPGSFRVAGQPVKPATSP